MVTPACPPPWKRCSCCGRAISREEWERLRLDGYQVNEADEYGPAVRLEIRTDTCGSTLAVEVEA